VVENENKSVDIVEQDPISVIEEGAQSNTEIQRPSLPSMSPASKITRSTSTKLGEEDAVCQEEQSSSNASLDLESSKRYKISLKLARDRALKSIKRAKERELLLDDDE